jgi:hypothetical protein
MTFHRLLLFFILEAYILHKHTQLCTTDFMSWKQHCNVSRP